MRRKLLAGGVSILLAIVVVWQHREIWRAIVYKQILLEVPEPTNGIYYLPVRMYLLKRFESISGPRAWVPDQVCTACSAGVHDHSMCNLFDEDGTMITDDLTAIVETTNSGSTAVPGDGSVEVKALVGEKPTRCICQRCFPGRKSR